MIYFKLQDFSSLGFETRKFVYLCNEKGITTDLIVKTPELLNQVRDNLINPNFIWLKEEASPILLFDNVLDADQTTNLTPLATVISSLYEKYGSITEPLKQQLITKYDSMIHNEKISEFSITVCIAQYELESKGKPNFPVNISAELLNQAEFRTITTDLINKHNATFKSVFKNINDSENVTMHQDSCTDTLFIEIPDRSVLLDDSTRLASLIPRRMAVCTPYSDKGAYSPKYKELNVPKHLYPAIEGRQENNFLPIQENEKKYYDALTDWVKNNIIEEFGSSEEIIDSLSKEYLTELADRIYSWHWGHNANVPANFIDTSDDEDGDDSAENSSSVESKYEFNREFGDSRVYDNAVIALNNFMEEASVSIGYRAYVEAVVKLARWGDRKPKALVLDGYDFSFDLATNMAIRNINISEYKVKMIDGHRYQLAAWITPSVAPQDTSVIKNDYRNTPFGMALKSVFVNDAGDELDIPVYYSLFDAVPMILSGKLSIVGVERTGDTLVCPTVESIDIQSLVTDYVQNTIQFQQNPFYRSGELKDLCFQFKTGKGDAEQNLMVIFNEVLKEPDLAMSLKKNSLSSLEDLTRKISNYEIYSTASALNINVASTMFSVMDKVHGCAGTDVLEQWRLALAEWKGITSFYSSTGATEPTEEKAESVAGSVAERPSATMTAFGGASASEGTEQWSSPLIHAPKANSLLRPIVNLEGKLIGAYEKDVIITKSGKKANKYVLLSLNTVMTLPKERLASNPICLSKMVSEFIQDLVYLGNNARDLPITFESVEAIIHFKNEIAALMRGVKS